MIKYNFLYPLVVDACYTRQSTFDFPLSLNSHKTHAKIDPVVKKTLKTREKGLSMQYLPGERKKIEQYYRVWLLGRISNVEKRRGRHLQG